MTNAYLLPLAVHRLGWIPFILFTLGAAAVLTVCLRRFLCMENRMGALVGLAATAALAVQVLTYYLGSFTPYPENICLPLISQGNVIQAGDALLIGLILSILRGQSLPEPSPSRPSDRALA